MVATRANGVLTFWLLTPFTSTLGPIMVRLVGNALRKMKIRDGSTFKCIWAAKTMAMFGREILIQGRVVQIEATLTFTRAAMIPRVAVWNTARQPSNTDQYRWLMVETTKQIFIISGVIQIQSWHTCHGR